MRCGPDTDEKERRCALPNYDLIAFDLDGTVFGTPGNQTLSSRVRGAFKAAREAGVTLTVASGRAPWMLGDEIPSSGFVDWAVCGNGAVVRSLRTEEIHAFPIPRDEALTLLETIAAHGGTVTMHAQSASFMELGRAAHMLEHGKNRDKLWKSQELGKDAKRASVNPIDALVSLGKMTVIKSAVKAFEKDPSLQLNKLDCSLPDEHETGLVMAELEAMGSYDVAHLEGTDLEITKAGISKGTGVSWLCEHLGIDETRAVAFGDSGNDISLTGRDLTFVAMGNASPDIKAAADDECESVMEDGVACWLERNLF